MKKPQDFPLRDHLEPGWLELRKQIDRLVAASRAWRDAFEPLERFQNYGVDSKQSREVG